MAHGPSHTTWDELSFQHNWVQDLGGSTLDFLQDPGTPTVVDHLQTPLHGMDPLVVDEMYSRGFEVLPALSNPDRAAQLFKNQEQDRIQPGQDVSILSGRDTTRYLETRLKQGLGQSEINRLAYDGLLGKYTREELRLRVAELQSQLPYKGEDWNAGWFLDNVLGMGTEIVGQMTRTITRGVGGALAAAPLGAWGGPGGVATAAAVGGGAAVLTRAAQENIGAVYLQLIEKPYELYRDLDNPDRYLTIEEYDLKRRTEDRYTERMGYTPESVEIPEWLAKSVASTFGGIMGGLELVKVGTFAKAVGGYPILQKLGKKAARQIIENGTIRSYVANIIGRTISLGVAETAQEVLQDVVGYTGVRIASELNAELHGQYDVSPEAKESFFGGMAKQAVDTAKTIGPPMLLLGGLGVGTGAVARFPAERSAARAKEENARLRAEGTTDYWFTQDKGEDVSIESIAVEVGEILDRDAVKAASILELVKDSNLTLPPIALSVRTDGSLFAEDYMSAAMTKVMRDAGMSSLRAIKVDKTKGIADSKQAAELFSTDPITSELASQFPNDSVAEIQAKVLFLQLAASRDGLALNEWLDAYFQEGRMFPEAPAVADPTPEPGVEVLPPVPTIDGALWDSPGPLVEATTVERPEGLPEPQMPAPPVVAEGRPVSPEVVDAPATTEAAIEPTIPGMPTIHPDFMPAEPGAPADPTVALPEELDEPSVAAAQMRVRIGETMSSKTYLAKVEADAEVAGDEFLAQAARNVIMDKFEAIEGDVMTPAEHTAELMTDLIEESGRLESEDVRQRRANRHALMKQADRERQEAMMAAELAPVDAAAPEITEVAEPEVELEEPVVEEMPYHLGEVPRVDLRPVFNTRIPAEASPVIYVDMDDNWIILSGLAEYNAAALTAKQEVSGTILRADEGVTLEEAQQHAARAGALADLPEAIPVARDAEAEVIPIKSDGETVGAVEFDENSKALLRAYDGMDLKSWLHGLAPVFRKMLPAREAAVAARWAGAEHTIGADGRVMWTWDDASNYKFAAGFMKYLQEGKVSFPELQPIWKNLSDWTKASYAVNRTRLTKPIRDIYESFLVDERSPALKAYQANVQMVGQVADMTFRSPVSATLLRLRASDGRALLPVEEGGAKSSPLVFVEALDTDGKVLMSREYKDVDSAVRDISGVPTADNPATIGDAAYRPHAAKQGPVSGFYGDVAIGDILPADAGPEGSIFVGGKPVDGDRFIGDVVRRLDEAGPLGMREGPLAGIVTSWRRYDYATELLANGVKGPLFQVLSRDIDTGRAAEKRTRFDLNDIQRNKLIQRGWTERQLRQLPGRMKEKVEVSGWKHKKAKDTWTIGDLLSFNRHLRAGQNRRTLLEMGFRDGPDGDLISVDEEDIGVLMRAYSTIPSELRDLGNEVVDELMDVIHEKMDPVHRTSRRRGLGYVPNYWDLERAPQDRSPEMIKEELENADALDLWRTGTDAKLGVFEGMTHHRTRRSAPIVLRPLDFQLMRNIDRASMYVGFELPLKTARQLFQHPQARAAMERRMGKDSVRGLEKGLEGVARRWVDESIVDRTFQALQRKVTISTLGGNVPVWIKQTLSLPLYGVYVPPKYLAASMMRAIVPSQFKEMRNNLSSFDPTFMARSKGFDISLQDTLEKTAAGEAWGKRRTTEVFMKMITFFDQRTVVLGSHAAYLQAIDEFRTGNISEELQRATQIENRMQARELTADQAAEKAYEYANWITVRSQPNFLPEHVSAFQRDRITRFLSMYSGYTNVAYNMLLRTRWRASQEKTPQSIASMQKAFFWIFVGNAAGVAGINYLKQVWLGRAPDEEELPSWILKELISSSSGLLYFVRDAVFAMQNEWADFSPSPIISAGKEIFEAVRAVYDDLIERGEVRQSTVKKTLRAAGFLTGWPLYSMQRYGEATYDLFEPMID